MCRRTFLRAGAVGLAATAGCAGRTGGGPGNADGELRLESLDVDGSPGGTDRAHAARGEWRAEYPDTRVLLPPPHSWRVS